MFQARIHDESVRYVLSDQAIVALATKFPTNATEVFQVIQQADLSTESSDIASVLPTPSHIVSTHMDEICFLLQEVDVNVDDVLKRYLQRHLDLNGCCPTSIYNYALLSEFNLKKTRTLFSKQNGGKFSTQVGKKASRELFVQKFSCKSPVYHNCRIYANDGRLLCYCDRRKLEWYVRRGLAKLVEDDPPAIMLLFEPKGRPEDEDNDFYIQSKKNICVGCGEKNHYLRYRIIPSCYRVHFPEHLKSHRSHDIVLLCVDCHEIAHSAAEKYKRQISKEFGIPLFVQKIVDSGESNVVNFPSKSTDETEDSGVSPLQLRTAAMALLRHGSTMPSRRHDELMQTVKTYFGGREISAEDLERALLVGMSPHEIRRLEKKKGLNLRRFKESNFHTLSGTSPQANGHDSNSAENNSKESLEYGDNSEIGNGQKSTSTNEIDVNLLSRAHEDISFINGVGKNGSVETFHKEKGQNGYGNPSDETGNPSDGTVINHKSSTSHQVLSSKSAKKLSLLGHGPHGKQVVEHLLSKYGDDGIGKFCQRWRQVFVETVHPRFLPLGWDIMHR
ncbi:uncharacterized protein A4U43_C03F17970 [Asparagus officinalis]|uniref:HRDC domain-containing protein n=1 Tax=Asparagus officinalis TaxID=4686 RepID=A0A5P1FG49_ASPOF|nr:protein RRP6-like 3 [Asparagus officinalis]ONK75540.1 uncharacterized protein A4U43_C03F17970 [Asparagus officinalis]